MDFRLLLLLAISFVPTDDVVQSRCDVIEINHVYRGELIVEPPAAAARTEVVHVADYVNFYRWRARDGGFQVIAWRCWDGTLAIKKDGLWHYRFVDYEQYRDVIAPCFRETWTPYDPEVLNRVKFDPMERPNLPKRWPPPNEDW